jgi:hypothetical protein
VYFWRGESTNANLTEPGLLGVVIYRRGHIIVNIMNGMLRVLCSILVAAPVLSQAPAPNEKVPIIDGGAGSCSVDLTVRGADGKPFTQPRSKFMSNMDLVECEDLISKLERTLMGK